MRWEVVVEIREDWWGYDASGCGSGLGRTGTGRWVIEYKIYGGNSDGVMRFLMYGGFKSIFRFWKHPFFAEGRTAIREPPLKHRNGYAEERHSGTPMGCPN